MVSRGGGGGGGGGSGSHNISSLVTPVKQDFSKPPSILIPPAARGAPRGA